MSVSLPICFDSLEPAKEEVTLGGKKYHLCEASGDVARKWKNLQISSARLTDGKFTGVGNIADAEIMLVSECLFDGEKQVPQSIVKTWRSSVVKALFERVKEISGMDETPTIETLQKRIAEDTAKLKELQAPISNGDNSDPKD